MIPLYKIDAWQVWVHPDDGDAWAFQTEKLAEAILITNSLGQTNPTFQIGEPFGLHNTYTPVQISSIDFSQKLPSSKEKEPKQ